MSFNQQPVMNILKRIGPDIAAVMFFVLLGFIYFYNPVSKGWVLAGHDNTAGIGSGVEMNEYRERHNGERTRWTNSLFSGMPTYQMAPSYDSTDLLGKVEKVYQLGLPDVVMYVFILLLGFYILLRAFNFKVWMAALGAVVWAFSSYFFIIIGAGHIWKLMVLAFIPPTIAGIVLCYRGKWLWGGLVLAFFTALQIFSNHVQMTYYFLPVMGCVALAFLVEAWKKNEVKHWLKATGVALAAALLGVCVNLSNLYHTYEYSKESMRGKSELTRKSTKDPANQTGSGLERDYITAWSYGIGETWTLLVPNVKGGASHPLNANKTAMEKADKKYAQFYGYTTQYWGTQPGTSGPVYVGAFVLTLFVLSLFILKGPMKWFMLAVTILSVLLSWGKNFMWFTNLFLDYVPMYDKFRTVASILVVAEFTIPFLAMLGLKKFVDEPEKQKNRLKYLYISAGITGGMALLFALMPGVFFGDCIGPADIALVNQLQSYGYMQVSDATGMLMNLTEMHHAMLSSDAWRSVIIIAIASALLVLYARGIIKEWVMLLGILAVCLIDMWGVNKRYMNDSFFERKRPHSEMFRPSDADMFIKMDKAPYFRVLNMNSDVFNENRTSYYHKSIGGYHPAKLRRYQEMVEAYISPEISNLWDAVVDSQAQLDSVDGQSKFPILNMLNMKYALVPQKDGTLPVLNPYAMGNGWFVNHVDYVPDADTEINRLKDVDLHTTAVVNERFRGVLGEMADTPQDSTSTVQLTAYEANALSYKVKSAQGGVIVFSDIYYPGWVATIDGQETDVVRANYILRAIRVTPGEHKVTFRFDPQSLHITEGIAYTALALMALFALLLLGKAVLRKKQQ